MPLRYRIQTDKKEIIQLDSEILNVDMLATRAFTGNYLEFCLKTRFVGDGAEAEIKCLSGEGRTLAKIKGRVFNDYLHQKLFIPADTDKTSIYLEAKLPKHSLKKNSGFSIPLSGPVGLNFLKWDKNIIKRNHEVKILGSFTGLDDVYEARITIYEKSTDKISFPIDSFKCLIIKNKLDVNYILDYRFSSEEIPSREEMEKINKEYLNPAFFFTVSCNGLIFGKNHESGLIKFLEDITHKCVDNDNNPLIGIKYSLTGADGSIRTGITDNEGYAAEKDLAPGQYRISIEEPLLNNQNASDNPFDSVCTENTLNEEKQAQDTGYSASVSGTTYSAIMQTGKAAPNTETMNFANAFSKTSNGSYYYIRV